MEPAAELERAEGSNKKSDLPLRSNTKVVALIRRAARPL